MQIPIDLLPNSIHKSNKYGFYKIINYINSTHIIIKFIETNYITTTQSSHIRRGLIKDKLYPLYANTGFIGEGSFSVRNRSHSIWASMIKRCYDPTNKYYPYYGAKGVTVCKEWHNFQNYAAWYESNYVENFHVDKDMKCSNNKIYSPDTCLFVPPATNLQFSKNTLNKTYCLIDNNGVYHHFNDQYVFAKKHNLDSGCLSKVISKQRKSHKGFSLPNHDYAKRT